MSTGKYILKTLGTHIVAVAVMTFMMIALILIFQDNMWYQVAVSFVLLSFYWIFMGFSLEKYALYDAKNNKFAPYKAIISAAIINIPNIIFIVLDVVVGGTPDFGDIFKLMFRYWNAGYLNFIILFKDTLWIRIVISLLYFAGLTLCYYRGMLIKKKTDAAIESMKEENKNKHIPLNAMPEDDETDNNK